MPSPRPALKAGVPLATANIQWFLLRTNGTQDADAALNLATATIDWSDIIVSVENANSVFGDALFDVRTQLTKATNGVTIAFFTNATGDAENDNFGFDLFAFKEGPYGPAHPVYLCPAAAGIIGTYPAKIHPTSGVVQADGNWVDTITGTDTWPSGVTVNDSNSNRICTLSFDMRGFRYLYLQVHSAVAATGTEAGSIGAIITGY